MKIFYLFVIILMTSKSFSQDNWRIIEPNWAGFDISVIYHINSFDNGQLILHTDGNIYHLFPEDLSNISLINFTDWNTLLGGVSGKSQSEIVFYGIDFNPFTFPKAERRRVYYKLFKDTTKNVDGKKFKAYAYDAIPYQGYSDAEVVYSNINTSGYGISVAKPKMMTFSYENWVETTEGFNDEYEAQCGVFHNDKNYIVAVNKQNEINILSTIDGSEWVLESTLSHFKFDENDGIVKLLINNENDYYIITKKGIHYSLDFGKNWNTIELSSYEINDAVLRNQNEIYFCGKLGLVAKLDLHTFDYQIFQNSIEFDLNTIHFTNIGDCWLGGKSTKLLKYQFGTSLEDATYKLENLTSIYPNPSQSFIRIKSPILENKSVIINIYDINSLKLHTAYLVAKSNELNIQLPTSLSNGVYFINIIDKNENQLLLNDSFIISK
ncbi:MAG: T9SS type A sorting domain-containing protein [Candidatus Kapabacteria bacterium]|nr:T9SS type A sorting domain-containing protein [Ignavibacteriota bacterium]MCW5883553.1 T9SS type A sorting domain-containing protein [Candidatus Kapabacteria bacterium]